MHPPIAARGIVIALGISEMCCFPLVPAATFPFSGHERMEWASSLLPLLRVARLLAVATSVLFDPEGGVRVYVWFHAAATAVFTLVALALVHWHLKPPAAAFSYALR